MSEPATEMFETVSDQKEFQPKPPREMSQAAIASFLYGTLQLLFTAIGSAVAITLMQGMKAFESAMSGSTGSNAGADSADVADVQKMIEELGIASPTPSSVPVAPTQGISGFSFEPTPSQIAPMEFLIILLTHGFGLLGLLTAFIAFSAVTKGKSGRGLAIIGLVSSLLSFVIAFMLALAI